MTWRTTRRFGCALAVTGLTMLAVFAFVLRPAADVPEFAAVKARWQSSEGYLLDRNDFVLDTLRHDYGVRRFAWVSLDQISPALVGAVIEGEDHRFRGHSGID